MVALLTVCVEDQTISSRRAVFRKSQLRRGARHRQGCGAVGGARDSEESGNASSGLNFWGNTCVVNKTHPTGPRILHPGFSHKQASPSEFSPKRWLRRHVRVVPATSILWTGYQRKLSRPLLPKFQKFPDSTSVAGKEAAQLGPGLPERLVGRESLRRRSRFPGGQSWASPPPRPRLLSQVWGHT